MASLHSIAMPGLENSFFRLLSANFSILQRHARTETLKPNQEFLPFFLGKHRGLIVVYPIHRRYAVRDNFRFPASHPSLTEGKFDLEQHSSFIPGIHIAAKGKIAQAVRNQPLFIYLHSLQNMGMMPQNEVCAAVYRLTGKALLVLVGPVRAFFS